MLGVKSNCWEADLIISLVDSQRAGRLIRVFALCEVKLLGG